MIGSWWPVAVGVAAGALGALAWGPLRRKLRRARTQRADRQFHLQREWLEAKFFDLAAGSGKPRGLRWTDCWWDDEVTFARDRRTGRLTAFVGVSIRFEAVEDGPMQDVPAVAQEKVASAVFHYAHGRWGTGGRVLFNLSPEQALVHYADQFEAVCG
jgi:hypothetical protein